MSSLRFRLPALFLGGVVVAALVTAVAAVGLFQDSTRADTFADLRQQAAGLADLYATQAVETGQFTPAERLEAATGSTLFYAGLELFTPTGLRELDSSVLPDQEALDGRPAADVRVHAAGPRPRVPRRRAPAPDRRADLRRDRRRQAARRAP